MEVDSNSTPGLIYLMGQVSKIITSFVQDGLEKGYASFDNILIKLVVSILQ